MNQEKTLEVRLNNIENAIENNSNELKILTSDEICSILRYNKQTFYQNKLQELVKFGMYKDGTYKMLSTDLKKYIDYLKQK